MSTPPNSPQGMPRTPKSPTYMSSPPAKRITRSMGKLSPISPPKMWNIPSEPWVPSSRANQSLGELYQAFSADNERANKEIMKFFKRKKING